MKIQQNLAMAPVKMQQNLNTALFKRNVFKRSIQDQKFGGTSKHFRQASTRYGHIALYARLMFTTLIQ